MHPLTIPVRYSCPACDALNERVQVPAREAGQDFQDWMHRILLIVTHAHSTVHPYCTCSDFAEGDVHLPLPTAFQPTFGGAQVH